MICLFLLPLGITDDDLRETAYEILLACAGASGYADYSYCIETCFLSSLHGISPLTLS